MEIAIALQSADGSITWLRWAAVGTWSLAIPE
jgi:hypothetical protein